MVFFFVNLAEMAIIHKTIEANLATQKKSGGNYIYIYIPINDSFIFFATQMELNTEIWLFSFFLISEKW